MRTIYVGFSKSKKLCPLGSWIIRMYQGGTGYSHVYIRLDMSKTRFPSDKILHASEGKILNMSKTQFDKRHEVVEEFEVIVSEETYSKVVIDMHEASGDDYGIMQNIGIVWVDLVRFFGKRISNPWISGWNCSEFVASILVTIFNKDFKDLDPNTCTPKDVCNILKRLESEYKVKNNNYI